jgi:integrase
MSVIKRGKVFHLRIRPFGPELITVRTPALTKTEAAGIERALLTACKSADYRALDPASRAVCIAMFRNRGLEIPPDLGGEEPVREELTLWKAIEIFLNYPGVKDAKARERYIYCLRHFVTKWGKSKPLKSLWIPDLRLYQTGRLTEGASPATVNWEMATLSRLFGVMIELQLLEVNPVRDVKRLSVKDSERQVYLSFEDVQEIIRRSPKWCAAMITTAFYTGMRRGEIVGLTRKEVDLAGRMITLRPENTKEGHWKRIPIHWDLIPVLDDSMKVRALGTDKVFLLDGRPPNFESLKNPWRKAVKAMELEPRPRFHDLRHTWKTNARRSGMDPEIRESILGHWFREKSVSERYGRISDRELIQAIDCMTFDHGATEIWASR